MIIIVMIKRISHTANASATTCKILASKLPIVKSGVCIFSIIHQASKANEMLAITDKGMARLYFFRFNEFMICDLNCKNSN